jgi:DNA segregation ATPase FtsK/SpoIIIE, S-DNA-T family
MTTCRGCGFRHGDVATSTVSDRLLDTVAELCAEVADLPDAVVRRRPAPTVWSVLEYCCHLRDVLVTQRERVVRALVEDRPEFPPMHRDERAALTRYLEEEPAWVVTHLRAVAEMAAWTFASLGAAQWTRTCVYSYPEPATRDLAWLGRHTVHEAVHHLADVRRILVAAGTPGSTRSLDAGT